MRGTMLRYHELVFNSEDMIEFLESLPTVPRVEEDDDRHAQVLAGCKYLQQQSFMREGSTLIALDLVYPEGSRQQHDAEWRRASESARFFHYFASRHPAPIDSMKSLTELAKGVCKCLVVFPDCAFGTFRPGAHRLGRLLSQICTSVDEIRILMQTLEGFRLLQLILMVDGRNSLMVRDLLELQSLIFLMIPVRTLLAAPVSLHAGDESIPEHQRRTTSLVDCWMRLCPRRSPKGWTHLNKRSNYRYKQYKMWQHYIAVDRAILRYCFKLCKGPLGRLHEDVLSDVEGYLYGGHSWPRFFFRDTYSRTKTRAHEAR